MERDKKMRDPNRIPNVLAVLGRVWYENPDWRLGQVIANAVRQTGRFDCDPFYIEDDEMVEALKELMNVRN